ncbi:nucleoside monophosphate kinase [Buchnera aphidicola]|uniref:adenylate kinase family protein n=1 Tax=Buchnera aphidicola TaxID=9 RepID=UPI0030D182BE
MKIILIGYPCSGKGTQAKFISKKYKIPNISISNLLKKEIKKKKNINLIKKIKNKIKSGKLVPDSIIINLLEKRLKKKDCSIGYILDGFPRTLNQAKIMYKKNIKIDYVIEILVSRENIFKRALGRKIHIPSGRTYHKIYNPPLIKNIDNITGENLTTRIDDTKEIVKKRLNEYDLFQKQIFLFYKKKENIKYFQINGNKKFKNVKNSIKKILN